MLKGSGLVITIRLLNSNICTSALNTKEILENVANSALYAQKKV
jgi:hypothetical protein